MFVHTVSRRTLAGPATALCCVAAAGLLLAFPDAMATGIHRGLSVCSAVIIPTLYPFMLLAGWLADSPLCCRPGRILSAVTRRLFGLPGCCGPAILLSLVGGYPAGALAIARLREQELVDDRQVRRMTAYCVNGGPGFIISTVGAGLLGSVQAGLLLFFAQATVSLSIGICLGHGHRRPQPEKTLPTAARRPVARLVADTCASLITMCGFVMLAAATLSVAEAAELSRLVQRWLTIPAAYTSGALAALLEVSCGCIALAGSGALAPLWLSLCISWGGLSVHGQLAAALKGHRVLTPTFLRWRLLHGTASGCVSLLLFRLFPITVSGSTSGTALLPFSVSAVASGMLLALSFLAMLCFSGKNTGKMSQDMLY